VGTYGTTKGSGGHIWHDQKQRWAHMARPKAEVGTYGTTKGRGGHIWHYQKQRWAHGTAEELLLCKGYQWSRHLIMSSIS